MLQERADPPDKLVSVADAARLELRALLLAAVAAKGG